MYSFSLRDGNSLNANEIEQLKNLWIELFDDSRDYLDAFFKVFLPDAELVIGMDGSEIISVSYMLPLQTNHNEKCYYLYSGGVTEKMRGKHVFTEANNYILSLIQDTHHFAYAAPEMVEWYKSFLFPCLYSCKEINILPSSGIETATGNIKKAPASEAAIKSMHEAYMSSIDYDYICYPDWFYHLLMEEKKISKSPFDIISIDGDDYYIVGCIEEGLLIIEETNIPSELITRLGQELLALYNVTSIKIKLPLSDSISDKESSIVYAGQGSTKANLWAPFALL